MIYAQEVENRISQLQHEGKNDNTIINILYREFKVRKGDIWVCVYYYNIKTGWEKRSKDNGKGVSTAGRGQRQRYKKKY